MRLRGINEESGELIPELRKSIKLLSGVEIMKDNDSFKSTFEIMKDVSQVWKDLTDKKRATLLEMIAGKRQGTVVASLLNNIEDGIKATESALNSAGSSAKEQETYMTSINAKVNTFKETVTKFWQGLVKSDSIKEIVDFGIAMVEVLDRLNQKFGSLNILFIVIMGIAIKLSLSLKAINIQLAAQGILSWSNALKALIPIMFGASTATGALNTQLTIMNILVGGIPLLIGAIVGGLMLWGNASQKAADNAKKLHEENLKSAKSTAEEIKGNNSKIKTLDSLASEYDELKKASKGTKEEEQKLHSIQIEMAKLFPQLADKVDILGNSYVEATNKVKAFSNAEKAAYIESLDAKKKLLALEKKHYEKVVVDESALGGKYYNAGESVKGKKTVTYNQMASLAANYGVESTNFGMSDPASIFANEILGAKLKDEKYKNEKDFVWELNEESTKKMQEAFLTKGIKSGELVQEAQDYLDQITDIEKLIKEINDPVVIKDPIVGNGTPDPDPDKDTSSKGSLKDSKEYIINSISYDQLQTERKAEILEYQIEIAKQQKDYNKEEEKTLELLENRKIKLGQLDIANNNLSKTADSVRKSSGYDNSNEWFDENNNETDTYKNLFNSLIDNPDEQDRVEGVKNTLKTLKDLYKDNENAGMALNKEIFSLNQTISSNKISILFQDSENALKPFNNELETLKDNEKLLKDDDFSGKYENLKAQLSANNSIVKETTKSLSELESTTSEVNKTDDIFISTKEKLESVLKSTNQEIKETNLNMVENAKALSKRIVDLDKENKYLQLEEKQKQKIANIEEDIYGSNQSDYEDSVNATIDALQEKLDILVATNKEKEEEETRAKKLLDLEEQRLKLANIKAEKDVKIFQNGAWEWVSDPRKIKQETETLYGMESDYADWEKDIAFGKQQDGLKAEIDYQKGLIDTKKKAFDEQSNVIEKANDEEKIKLDKHFAGIEKIYDIHYSNLFIKFKGNVDAMVKYEAAEFAKLTAKNALLTGDNIDPSKIPSSGGSSKSSGGTFVSNTVDKVESFIDKGKEIIGNILNNGSKSTAPTVVKAQADGTAQKGLSVGTIVKTAGGDYKITGVKADGSYKSSLVTGETGLYTGNQEGLMYVHKKELLLNDTDTPNFLEGLNIVKDIVANIKLPTFNMPTTLAGIGGQTIENNFNFGKDSVNVQTNDVTDFMHQITRKTRS